VADPVITPQRALALLATVADGRELLEADGGNVMTPQRQLAILATVADCHNILEAERQRVENGAQQQAAVQPKPGGSALAPESAR
jgi:hypothetical protein